MLPPCLCFVRVAVPSRDICHLRPARTSRAHPACLFPLQVTYGMVLQQLRGTQRFREAQVRYTDLPLPPSGLRRPRDRRSKALAERRAQQQGPRRAIGWAFRTLLALLLRLQDELRMAALLPCLPCGAPELRWLGRWRSDHGHSSADQPGDGPCTTGSARQLFTDEVCEEIAIATKAADGRSWLAAREAAGPRFTVGLRGTAPPGGCEDHSVARGPGAAGVFRDDAGQRSQCGGGALGREAEAASGHCISTHCHRQPGRALLRGCQEQVARGESRAGGVTAGRHASRPGSSSARRSASSSAA